MFVPLEVEVFGVRGIARNPNRRYPWPRSLATLDPAQLATVEAEAAALGVGPEARLQALYRAQSSHDRAIADEEERLDLLHLAIGELSRTARPGGSR